MWGTSYHIAAIYMYSAIHEHT